MPCSHAASVDSCFWTIVCACCQSPAARWGTTRARAESALGRLQRGAAGSGGRLRDVGGYIAGRYCAALLADLGADVIRIERLDGGEDRWVAPVGEDG